MNTPSASPAEPRAETPPPEGRVLVWDLPVRVFHWLLVLSFAGAYLTAESEAWRLVHITLGYTVAGLVVFRLLWGLVGTRHARFRAFVRGPAEVRRHLAETLRGQPPHSTGHNPVGALAIVGLLALALLVALTGWSVDQQAGPLASEDWHEAAANAMLALAALHVVGVLAGSWLGRENLVRAMVTGRKRGAPDEAIRSPRRWVGALVLVAVLGYWGHQWQTAPMTPGAGGAAPGASHADRDGDDD